MGNAAKAKMGSLGKRLKRELVKSPAKAALLGLVCLIALWYWAPILGDCLTGASNAPADIVVKPAETVGPDIGLIATAKENVGKTISTVCNWQSLAEWLDEDPRAKPAVATEGYRDPFRRAEASATQDVTRRIQELIRRIQEGAEEESTELVAPPEGPVEKQPEFSDLSLVLGGTIVGSQVRSATINGNTYWLRNDASDNQDGRTIQIPLGARSGTDNKSNGQTITLKLVDVQADHVVLKLREEEHRLNLDSPRLAMGNQIVRHGAVERINDGDGGQNEATGNLGFISV